MKLEVSDVIWTPFTDDDNPNAGNVLVEHHLSGWQRSAIKLLQIIGNDTVRRCGKTAYPSRCWLWP